MNLNEDKINFCVNYLFANGIDAEKYAQLVSELSSKNLDEFEIVRKQDHVFFTRIAIGLREMWPSGNKDDKWPWRESVPVLTDRLKFIWEKMEIDDKYTVEDCLQAGRRYLAQYEHSSTKYMQLLKYFIFKQKDMGVTEKGVIKKSYESTLVKMLQEKDEEEQIPFDEFIV